LDHRSSQARSPARASTSGEKTPVLCSPVATVKPEQAGRTASHVHSETGHSEPRSLTFENPIPKRHRRTSARTVCAARRSDIGFVFQVRSQPRAKWLCFSQNPAQRCPNWLRSAASRSANIRVHPCSFVAQTASLFRLDQPRAKSLAFRDRGTTVHKLASFRCEPIRKHSCSSVFIRGPNGFVFHAPSKNTPATHPTESIPSHPPHPQRLTENWLRSAKRRELRLNPAR